MNGSTQLNAFEEVGDVLGRTSAACGFRWNAVVRHEYEQALKLARRYWKEAKRASSDPNRKKRPLYEPSLYMEFGEETNTITMIDVIRYLQSYDGESLARENQMLREQNRRLQEHSELLEQKIVQLKQDQEAYETLMRIMQRAKSQVLFGEEQMATTFQMDKNGNLERISETGRA